MTSNVLNCQTCGGTLVYSPDGLSAKCPYCGNEYHFKSRKGEALSLALNRANLMRRSCDFDGAITEYNLILSTDGGDAEAHWGLALSTYGIEYVEDSRTKKLIPTCRRTVRQSIFDNPDYVQAIDNADPAQAQAYAAKAKVIDRLQKDIMRRMDEEQDYDVFICFRSADENGLPTRERTIARRIYDELTRRGIKTFFSEVTLKDRIGDDYEPIIYKALYSCKFFILVAVSEQNINSPWVKNEWSRYRDRMAEEGLTGACCAVYEGMSLADFPAFMRSVQGVNLAKYPAGGYEIELADNICRRFGLERTLPRTYTGYTDKPKDLQTMLERAQLDLDDEIYGAAFEDYQKILNAYPRCGEAWWGCFLASQKANTGALAAQKTDYAVAAGLSSDRNLRNAERFADEDLRATIASYKKMCIYRCGELAAECNSTAEKLASRIEGDKKQLEEISVKKQAAAKKREKTAKYSDPKKFARMMRSFVAAVVILMIIFVIMAVFVGGTAAIVFFAMLFMFAVVCVITIIMMGIKRKNAQERADELGLQVSGYYAQEKRLKEQIADAQTQIEEENRKEKVFSSVFR
ncbi:MAG: toll/interleukin-1 receptor domain-containing protein [Clostridia bacterium]|nr:toll/interleukin-1 receptor domain-containing protein [Clostridia bacterium]